ncbi:MAG: TIGR04282 family arsenosugar biosynthesis glycosyltransferase [Frankia sp.]
MAKEPGPGRVKTRLCPPYTAAAAAALAAAALADTFAAVAHAATREAGSIKPGLVLAGDTGPWVPPGLAVVAQRPGPFDERLAGAFEDAGDGAPTLLIGMDTPQVSSGLLTRAVRALRSADAVFGPAADGGWWALGMRQPDGDLIRGIPTSRSTTGAHQRHRLMEAGLRVTDLAVLRDVDTMADVEAVAAEAPNSRFAATAAALRPAVAC